MRLTSKPDVLRLEAKRDVDGLVHALGYRADAGIQETATIALVSIGEPAIEPLIQALAIPNLQVPAMETLRNIGVLSINPLVNALKTDERQNVRIAAAKILADIGMFAIEPLLATLRHRSPEVRTIAIKTLIGIGPLAVEPLIAQLGGIDHPPHVRIEILKALSQLGSIQATSALLNAAQNDPSTEVSEYAARALGMQDLSVKSIASVPQPTKVNKPRGLSRAFHDKDERAEAEEQAKREEVEKVDAITYRWSNVMQVLPKLQPIPFDVLQRLIRTHSVHRRYSKPFEVVEDLEREYTQYSRLKESDYADISIRLVFDNEITRVSNVMPATRQLEIIIVSQEHQYFIFLNATYIEHYW